MAADSEVPIRIHVGHIFADIGSIAQSPDAQRALGEFFRALGDLLDPPEQEGNGDGVHAETAAPQHPQDAARP